MMLLQDLRYAARALRANKGFAAVAVLCMALGIGVNTTVFSVTDGVLIRPLPYEDPENLVILNGVNRRLGVDEGGLSYADLRDWREQGSAMSSVAGFQGRSLTIVDHEEPERLPGAAINWELFSMLGVQPIVGRGLQPDDDRPGAVPVVLLSHSLWQRRYAADPALIGETISVNGRPHTVIGVMPPRFEFPSVQKAWVALEPLVHQMPRSERSLVAFARLAPGVSLERAREELAATAARLEQQFPENRGWSALVQPMRDEFIPEDVELVILTMMGAATLVLAVACANVANLLLARASTRQREMAIRAALGAGRARILRQLLTESVVIAFISAPLGIVLAFYGTDLLSRAMPPDQVPYYIGWTVDGRSLSYTVAVAVVTGIVFGLVPALQAVRTNLQENLKEGGHGAGGSAPRNRLRNGLVVAEVAVSLVLLVGALLFVRSFVNLQRASGGFDARPLMTMRFYLTSDEYAPADAKVRRVEDILRRVEALPGVEAAFASNLVPLSGGGDEGQIVIDGRSVGVGEEPIAGYVGVSPHLVRTLGVTLLRGRDFTDTEGMTRSGIALINQTMAKQFWLDADSLGSRFRFKSDGDSNAWLTVVGIVADFRHGELLDRELEPSAYVPLPYSAFPNTGLTVRVQGDPAGITDLVRRQIRESDPTIPLSQIRTMEELRQLGFWQYKIFGWMFSIFGAVAVFLAAMGVYGILAYSVAQRTQEIGVRVALGAEHADVIRLFVVQGVRLAGVGIALGLLAAFGTTRVVRSLLYNVTPTDPASFGIIIAFLVLVAVVASYVPARLATTVDPMVALRVE